MGLTGLRAGGVNGDVGDDEMPGGDTEVAESGVTDAIGFVAVGSAGEDTAADSGRVAAASNFGGALASIDCMLGLLSGSGESEAGMLASSWFVQWSVPRSAVSGGLIACAPRRVRSS
jgi:hypothetical protein